METCLITWAEGTPIVAAPGRAGCSIPATFNARFADRRYTFTLTERGGKLTGDVSPMNPASFARLVSLIVDCAAAAVDQAPSTVIAAGQAGAIEVAAKRRNHPRSDDMLREVADAYRAAKGYKRSKAVADALMITHTNAATRVAQARKLGYLEPVE